MKIIIPLPTHHDIEEYAIFRGTLDAIKDTFSPTLFSFKSKIASSLRDLYETAYLMEKESHVYEHSCEHEVEAIVRDYSELKGWGSLYADELLGLLPFSYREIADDHFISEGDRVTVRFKYTESHKIQAVKITRAP